MVPKMHAQERGERAQAENQILGGLSRTVRAQKACLHNLKTARIQHSILACQEALPDADHFVARVASLP